jgi:hypothetical protein
MYRDAANWKTGGQIILDRPFSPEEREEISSLLHENELFVPEAIGIAGLRPGEWSEDDHPRHELCLEEDVNPAPSAYGIDMTTDDLLERFREANWEEEAHQVQRAAEDWF